MTTNASQLDAIIAARLEQAARRIVPVVAFIIVLVQIVYEAGFRFGAAIHHLNDRLCAAWIQRPEPRPIPEVVTHPLREIADELELLTVKELRAITGIRRRCTKAQLIAQHLAL